MSEYRYFDESGNELFPPEPVGELTHVGSMGGSPDETIVILYVSSDNLDKNLVSDLLEVQPLKAWNPGEKHSYGKQGYSRIAKWGQWQIESTRDDSDIEAKIISLLKNCSSNFSSWKTLTNKYDVCLTIVGYFNNWNREFFLSKETLKEIQERNISLKFDAYFLGENDESDE